MRELPLPARVLPASCRETSRKCLSDTPDAARAVVSTVVEPLVRFR